MDLFCAQNKDENSEPETAERQRLTLALVLGGVSSPITKRAIDGGECIEGVYLIQSIGTAKARKSSSSPVWNCFNRTSRTARMFLMGRALGDEARVGYHWPVFG